MRVSNDMVHEISSVVNKAKSAEELLAWANRRNAEIKASDAVELVRLTENMKSSLDKLQKMFDAEYGG